MKEDRDFVVALARGLDVLTCFKGMGELLGNLEIAERSNLPKSTVARLTFTLTKLGYLDFLRSEAKYRLGGGAVAFGATVLRGFSVQKVAAPFLKELAAQSNSSVSLGVREKLSMVYVEHFRCGSPLSLNAEPGWRVPIDATALGRAYLSVCSREEQALVVNELKQERPSGFDVDQLLLQAHTEFEVTRCCTSYGDWHKDVNAVATAVRFHPGEQPVAISCGGPSFTLTPSVIEQTVRPLMLETADRIAAELQKMM